MNYQHLHDRIISQAKARVKSSGQRYETHHIIPRSMGGTDEESNLVSLTTREHFIIHYLLTKMTTGEDRAKMIYAVNRMKGDSSGQGKKYMNSRLYSANKRRMAEIQSHKCIIDGIEFSSIKEAQSHYGVHFDTIKRWLKGGGKSSSVQKKKPCIINGKKFSNQYEAADYYGVSRNTIYNRIKEGDKNRPLRRGKNPCIIDGKEFSSLREASRQLGISREKIKQLLTQKT